MTETMSSLTGYQRAVLVATWIKTKPVNSAGERLDLETYIKKVCKAKKIEYREIVKNNGGRHESAKIGNQQDSQTAQG